MPARLPRLATPAALGSLVPAPPAAGRPGDPGLVGPGSAAWRLGRERVLLAAGPAALLLQVAHPLVAEGVAAHSGFTGDPLRRLHGTLDAVLTVTFGDSAQVDRAARRVSGRHRPVRGALPVATGRLPAGTPYRADDPDLALWVFATLVWTAVTATAGFVRPLPVGERDAYLRDMTPAASLFGVAAGALPERYADLERYVADQVQHVLAVGPTARTLARQVLHPDPPILPVPARPLPAVLTAGVLPAPVRAAYGLPWRRREQAAYTAVRCAARAVLPVLPRGVRYWPHYLVARERVGAAPSAG